jgi:hypothetical protein
MRFDIHRPRAYGDVRDVIADVCEEFLATMSRDDAFAVPDGIVLERDVRVVLGGIQDCKLWGVASDAVGFMAITSNPRRRYVELNDRHEIRVNLDLASALLGRSPADEAFHVEVTSWLVTLPREVLNVIDWIEETRGLTPLQVFDFQGGLKGIRAVVGAVESRRAASGDVGEDDRARAYVDKVLQGLSVAYADRIATAFAGCQPAIAVP